MHLDVNIEGFANFGQAADELSALFTSFTKKLQNINIIDDSTFLSTVLDAIKKIYNLSEVFGRFKETILITSEIKIPKTIHDTKVVLEGVMDELNCAINYINNFVTPDPTLINAQLSDRDKNIITKAVNTIENWNDLCEHGVSIALDNHTDIKYIKTANTDLLNKTNKIKDVTSKLRAKLSNLNL